MQAIDDGEKEIQKTGNRTSDQAVAPTWNAKRMQAGKWVGGDGWEIECRPNPLSLVLAVAWVGLIRSGRPVLQLN